MQITIFGASGQVGQLVVTKALAAQYDVIAVTHSHNPFNEQPGLKVMQGSINDQAFVRQTVQGSEAIISTLGSWHAKTKDIVSSGTASIIQAMQAADITRVITLTGTAALANADKPKFLDKLSHSFLKLVAPKILIDGERHLRLLEATTLDWTCVRSPAMSQNTSEAYELRPTIAPLWVRCSRKAVAKCLIDQINNADFLQSAPVIYQK